MTRTVTDGRLKATKPSNLTHSDLPNPVTITTSPSTSTFNTQGSGRNDYSGGSTPHSDSMALGEIPIDGNGYVRCTCGSNDFYNRRTHITVYTTCQINLKDKTIEMHFDDEDLDGTDDTEEVFVCALCGKVLEYQDDTGSSLTDTIKGAFNFENADV